LLLVVENAKRPEYRNGKLTSSERDKQMGKHRCERPISRGDLGKLPDDNPFLLLWLEGFHRLEKLFQAVLWNVSRVLRRESLKIVAHDLCTALPAFVDLLIPS
jgi:hypothetical protein